MTKRKGGIGRHYGRKRSSNKKLTIKKSKENININLDENGKDTTLQQDIDTHMTENRKLGWKGKGGGRVQSIDSGWREKRGIKSRDVRIKQLESETITLTKKT